MAWEPYRRRKAGERTRLLFVYGALCLAVSLAGCLGGATTSPETVEPEDRLRVTPPADWPAIAWPKDNPYSAAKAALGRDLFFEFNLSRDGTINCAWCHSPTSAFSDGHHAPFSTGVGHQFVSRNTPTLANVAFAKRLLSDGSQPSLEAQALVPLTAPNEMDMTPAEIEARLSADTAYVRLFRKAFGPGAITLDRVAKALATYQRTLISYQSPYDRWQAGEEEALAPEARRGAELFFGEKGGCASCHVPPLFTDGEYHNMGLDSVPLDAGRGRVTGLAADAGKFRTPTLRNVAMTGPYMHDGRFWNLQEVLEHYNAGRRPHPNTDARVRPLGLTYAEAEDLRAFLESLTDNEFPVAPWP